MVHQSSQGDDAKLAERPYVDIVLDGPPSHESGRFVEAESPQGTSVRIGEWIDRGDGFWALRIPLHHPHQPQDASIVQSLRSLHSDLAAALDEHRDANPNDERGIAIMSARRNGVGKSIEIAERCAAHQPQGVAASEREGLEAAIRAAELALFVIRKQDVMPNSSWESGFNADLKKAKDALATMPQGGVPSDASGYRAGIEWSNSISRTVCKAVAEWCEQERYALGAVDGYDYRSGEEYGLRRAQIELERRAALPSPQAAGVGEIRAALDDLQKAEAQYRLVHDVHGPGAVAGNAWFKMRVAGDRARDVLSALTPLPAEGLSEETPPPHVPEGDFEGDVQKAIECLHEREKRSPTTWMAGCTSFVQRRLQCGYYRAATLLEEMEKRGLVTEANNLGLRELTSAARDRLIKSQGRDDGTTSDTDS